MSLLFGVDQDTLATRLLSLGKDRVLVKTRLVSTRKLAHRYSPSKTFKVEYDLENSHYDELIIKDKNRIEQYGVPMAMLWHPPIQRESFILTVNDQVNVPPDRLLLSSFANRFAQQWKYKLYNSKTKMCRKTLLGPTFGSHLKK